MRTDEFKLLAKCRKEGMNLLILGFDGYDVRPVQGDTPAEKIENCYKDTSRHFGHELCLYALLVLKPKEYPWRKYKTEDF
jgi:hypothetical protein